MPSNPTQLSKFLSLVLRHKPQTIGIVLDPQGWVPINELLERSTMAGRAFSRAELLEVVASSDKQRFTLSADGQSIRAAQGHSVPVELGLAAAQPPPILYHGTATRSVEAILREGLKPQKRQQVHLSMDLDTARRVGQRHGTPAIFEVAAERMHSEGFAFFQADNGVWLSDCVPPSFLTLT